jgi:hypothetical protein
MADSPETKHNEGQLTQRTRPKKGKPIDIPVPKRGDFDRLLDRAAKPSTTRRRPDK